MWLPLAFGGALFAGLTAILVKVGIKDVNSHLATALRTVVVLVFAWIVVLVVGTADQLSTISGESLLFLGLSGLATGGSWMCTYRALQLGDVNKVTPVDKSSTILTMILAFVIFGEPITWLTGVAMALMALGTWLMIQKKPGTVVAKGGYAWLAYAAAGAVFASLVSVLVKMGVSGVDSNLATALRTIVVLGMAWIIVFAQGLQKDIPKIDKKSWLFLGLSGVATGLSWLCNYGALQMGPASVVAPIDKLSILVTMAFSYFVLKEKLSARAAVGLVLIVGGTLLLLVKL